MARVQPTADPYRILGVLRGATPTQIKAAHRPYVRFLRAIGAANEWQARIDDPGWRFT